MHFRKLASFIDLSAFMFWRYMKAQRLAKCILHNISADSIDLLNQACQLDHRSLNVRRVFLPKVQTLLHLSKKNGF